jgi:hypothetical protein
MLAKEARGQRDVALDVIEKTRVDLRQHEGHPKRARLGRTSAARAFVAKIGERHVHALGGFGPHGLIVAQHTIDRRHTDAGSPRNHHPGSRHGSPPPRLHCFCLIKLVFSAKNASFFRALKPSFDCMPRAMARLFL